LVYKSGEHQILQDRPLQHLENRLDAESIADLLETVLPAKPRPLPLHEPTFAGNEWSYVRECLDTGWVSSVGSYVDRFEGMVSDYTGAKYVIATVSGTAALHICLRLVGVEPGDEVLLPSLTFVATANAVKYCGAEPHFVESDERTLGVDPVKLIDYLKETARLRTDGCFNKRTGARIRALVPMHTFGHPVDLEPVLELCPRFRLELVEDAAESLGSYYMGRHTGCFGKAAALSFNGNKVVTTGGGGAILTNDCSIAKLARHITTTARVAHRWSFVHDQVGYNYRMPNLNAALGCAQLEQLPRFIEKKRILARKYMDAFRDVVGLRVFKEPPLARSNYWLNALFLDESYASQRDEVLDATHQRGLITRPPWILISKLVMYQRSPRMELPVAEKLQRRIINLPSSPSLIGDEET
jgi:perosamine synthetase